MRQHRRLAIGVIALLALASPFGAAAQQPVPSSETGGAVVQGNKLPVVPLEVQIVISKYQGTKRTSSLPYVLALNANSTSAQLNVGAQVAVPETTFAPAGDKAANALRSYSYKTVGTNIECSAVTADDGRFELTVSVDDSSVFTNAVDGSGQSPLEMPAFKQFKSRNKLLLRSGQTRTYTAATDRVSGETIRIEVTLTVVK